VVYSNWLPFSLGGLDKNAVVFYRDTEQVR